ncbi:MAG: AraC family ligand binding domain-containing protein, partial [Chitinophagaceae bacterium]
MKPLIEKLPLGKDSSFVARTYRTPHFEVPWHQHTEYELILFIEGEGRSFVGNYIGEFRQGDIFLLGSNLPHTFQKANKDLVTGAVVVQFREDFWGSGFLELPECKSIRQLLEASMKGLRIKGETKTKLAPLLHALEQAEGFHRITGLCQCLELIAVQKEYDTVSTQDVTAFLSKKQERIDKIFRYTIDHFQEPV